MVPGACGHGVDLYLEPLICFDLLEFSDTAVRNRELPIPTPPAGDRPGDLWICGRAECGEACPGGPRGDGSCGGSGEKCRPRRSWAGRRRAARNACLVIAAGITLLAIGGPWRREFLAPGPLTQPHAQILSGQLRNDRCAACHPAARGSLASWFGTGQVGHANVSQNSLCVTCHHATISPQRQNLAHNLTTQELATVSASQVFASLQLASHHSATADSVSQSSTSGSWLAGLRRPAFQLDDVACAACHREHRGSMADLSWLTDEQCQSCHQDQFESFSQGHPEFADWPYQRGGQVAFNHATHQQKHFGQQNQVFDCRSCHALQADGTLARVASYESSCASCHDKPLKLQAGEGLSLLALPTLDLEPLGDEALSLADGGQVWPELATGVDRLDLPVITRMLLQRDEAVKAGLDVIEQAGERIFSEPPSREQMEASQVLARAMHDLTLQLAENPQEAIKQNLPPELAAKLVEQLSPQLVATAYQLWFQPTGDRNANGSTFKPTTMLPAGGWYRDDRKLAIHYQGSGHADRTLQAVCELAKSPDLSAAERAELQAIPAVAACLVCHPGVEAGVSSSWLARRSDHGQRTFTKFSHQPHLNIQALADCQQCHQVQSLPADDSHHALHPNVDFKPLHRATCVQCHRSSAAGDACVQCHRYHVDPPHR